MSPDPRLAGFFQVRKEAIFRGPFQEISELAHKDLSFKILCRD